ncbi:putative methyltransferase-domain-containing protein [Butyriboletus roseoflavus]|nr:putative methyltransferase-domain-containing protein [Butyriboletus roseoflavus]
MFYYISFLRPPPLQASMTPTEPILITPQICNDLRTEYRDDPIDIYYAWSLHAPYPTSPMITKPTKLTSWRTSTAYKEIPVPRPPHLDSKWNDSVGQSWRLILTCGTTQNDQVVVLGETDTTGLNVPFAVMSMPVSFPRGHGPGNKNVVKGTKQERIARSYSLRLPLQDRPIVFDITEQTSFDLDKKIWDSGIGLSSWLVQLFAKGAETGGMLYDLRESLFSTDARYILELGTGTGIVAITLAILRSTLDLLDQPGSILTTDLPSAIPILQENVAFNHPLMSECVPQPVVLDWEHEELPPLVQAQLKAGLDVIVMADVTYNTASFSALIGTLSRLIQLCKQRRNGRLPRVLMGYKERHPDERSLWDRAKAIDLHFQQIAQVNGAGGNPVEIWLG